MVRLRSVGLTAAYRRNLRDAGHDLVERLFSNGHVVTRRTPVPILDKWLEEAVQQAYEHGEKLYWVTLGILGIQRGYRIAGTLLKGTWQAVRGWRSLKPIRSRVPTSAFCLENIVLYSLKLGWEEEGETRRNFWGCLDARGGC